MYTLRTGLTIELTFEQWDRMTDEDEEYLTAYSVGNYIENPFKGSALEEHSLKIDLDLETDVPELDELSNELKRKDIDLDEELLIE